MDMSRHQLDRLDQRNLRRIYHEIVRRWIIDG